MASARKLKHLRVFSRRPEAREAFAESVRKALGLKVTASATFEDAVKDAPIVTLITNATQPFFDSTHATKGSHVNAMGAIVAARAEFAQDIFPRCGLIAVDSVDNVRELSAEFRQRYGAEKSAKWDAVLPISRVIAAPKSPTTTRRVGPCLP